MQFLHSTQTQDRSRHIPSQPQWGSSPTKLGTLGPSKHLKFRAFQELLHFTGTFSALGLRDLFNAPTLAAHPSFEKGSPSLRWVKFPCQTSCHGGLTPRLPWWRPSPTSTGRRRIQTSIHLPQYPEVKPRGYRNSSGIPPSAHARGAGHR